MERMIDQLRIIQNKEISKDVYELILEGEGVKLNQYPGQFVSIKINDGNDPYLRRPFSICDINEKQMTILYKVVGEGTKLLSTKQKNDYLDVLLGLGNGFTSLKGERVLLIGGGIGIPPLYLLAKELKKKGIGVVTILGFKNKQEVFYEAQFKEFGDVYCTTDDGSYGMKGFVVDALSKVGNYDCYYTCGPTAMLKSVYHTIKKDGYLSFEARMACATGVCNACAMKVKTNNYKKICVDGPIFHSSEVLFDE